MRRTTPPLAVAGVFGLLVSVLSQSSALAEAPIGSDPLPAPPVQPVEDDWDERDSDIVVGAEQWERDLDGDGTADRRYCCRSGGRHRFRPLNDLGEASLNALQADFDDDGYFETVQWDTNGDGDRDRSDSDTDEDGRYDTIRIGWNGTRFRVTALDTDGDGALDRVRVDRNGDGVPDLEYIDRDGILPMDEVYVDADFDRRMDAHYFDHDGDGAMDEGRSVGRPDGPGWIDLDRDGVIDQEWIDTNGDGVADTTEIAAGAEQQRFSDVDGDGVYETGTITGPDGTVETVTDLDQDGVWDVWARDTDGDGIDDVFSYDDDGDGRRDSGVWAEDTDGDGTVDVRFEDTDGDGAADIISPSDSTGRPSAGGTVEFDRDGDGRFEERHEDVDGDGLIDHAYYDHDGDGLPETTVTDDDQDGDWDVVSRDTNGDGLADEWAVDTDDDRAWDTWERDTDGDGAADVWSYDLDGDGVRDAGAWEADTDGDGEPDVRYEDTDGDGFADVETPIESSSDDVPQVGDAQQPDDAVGGWGEVECAYDLANPVRESLGVVALPGFVDNTQLPSKRTGPSPVNPGGCQALSLSRPGSNTRDGASLTVSIFFDPVEHATAVSEFAEFQVIEGLVELAGQPGVDRVDSGESRCGVLHDRPDLHEIYATRFVQDEEIGVVTIGEEPLPSLVTLQCEAGVRLEVGGVRVVIDTFAEGFMCTDYVVTMTPDEWVTMYWSEQIEGEWESFEYRLDGPHSGPICPSDVLARQSLPSQAVFEADFDTAVAVMNQVVDRVALPAWLFDDAAFEAGVVGD